jgi:purine-binding chemotaxis protein CheW
VSETGATNVSNAADPRHWEALARAAAQGGKEESERSLPLQLLTFELDGAPYAVPVERVREVVRIRPITRVPRVPIAVSGVISLRGEVLQLIDLRRRLSLPPVEPTRASRIIVIRYDEGRAAALLVDAVTAVLRVTEDAILPATHRESGAVDALCVRGDEFVSLINLARVLEIDAEL